MFTSLHVLPERPCRDVTVLGSSQLVRSLLEADLVDALDLMIEPIVLGGGKSIFPTEGAARRGASSSCPPPPWGTGVQVCWYQRTL